MAPLGKFSENSVLQNIDLTDNCIGELENIWYLSKFVNLVQLSFQKANEASKGSNAICDLINYHETIDVHLPSLQVLDGQNKNHKSNSNLPI